MRIRITTRPWAGTPALKRGLAALAVAMLAGTFLVSCDLHDPTGPGSITTITVTPNVTLAIQETQQFTAVATDADGNEVSFSPVWSVVADAGTIDGQGLFTAGTTLGVFTVTAASGDDSGTATVTVVAGPLASITVTPNPTTLQPGATRQFTATGADAGGNIVDFTPTWAAVNGGGTIASNGLFTAGGSTGTFNNTVRASSGGLSGFATVTVIAGPLATITVTPNPDTLVASTTGQFTATGADANGNPVTITPSWTVVNGGGAIDSNGLFTAGGTTGTFTNTVRASSGGVDGFATVTVVPGAVATITVTPNPDTLAANTTSQFTATAADADGNPVTITPSWTVVSGGGVIDSNGLFTAGGSTGTFTNTVRASSGGVNGFATVTVVAGPLATITVTPDPDTLGTNTSSQFTAVGADANGNPVVITPTWAVVNGGGTIDSNGLFTAGNLAGTFINTVRASSGGVNGFATVTVQAGPLLTITVTPNPETLETNTTSQFMAVGEDADGNPVAITPTWVVVNGGGTIDSNGLFTAGGSTGTFTNTVRASSDGSNGFATVTVVLAPTPAFLDLGAAAPNGIIAGTEVTCIIGGLISADISIHPGLALSGFGPAECAYTGDAYLGDAVAQQAQIDLTTAYNTLVGLACGTNIVANLGGTTLLPGVYCSASSIGVTGPLTLDGNGDPDAVFVFQAGSTLTTAGDVILINGAQAKNVYWQVGSSATLGTASQWQGNILALTSITLNDNARLLGRALANNGAVTLGTGNTITLP